MVANTEETVEILETNTDKDSLDFIADKILKDNMEAFKELAK